MIWVQCKRARTAWRRTRFPRRIVGHHVEWGDVFYSRADWHRQTFKSGWVKWMAWNKAALREEGGISTANSRAVYDKMRPRTRGGGER